MPPKLKTDLKADESQLAAETTATVKPGEDPSDRKGAKEELAAAAAKLDLLKRANALDQDTYFSKPATRPITQANRSSTRNKPRSTINNPSWTISRPSSTN